MQDMAELMGLPVWQIEQRVAELRARPPVANSNAPMPGSVWLKTQLWKWALAAVLVVGLGAGIGFDNNLKGLTAQGWKDPANRTTTDGIYDHDSVVLGRQLGMTAPPGFSYKIKYGTLEASANGDSKHYVHVDRLTKENLELIQEQYARAILDGLGKATAKVPPEWIDGKAVALVKPNYYDANLADPLDITLEKDGFPYSADHPASKKMHDDLLRAIKEHWNDITD